MGIIDQIKPILSITIKPRQDSFTDQFCRVVMVKLLMIATLLVGLNWYSDQMTCIIPGSAGISGGFVSTACWINGLYIYKDITTHDDIGYYGIPRDINNDGTTNDGKICATTDTSHRAVDGCMAMEKTFYIQYQFMVFVLAVLTGLYYLPYTVFCFVNKDMCSLKASVADNASAETIVENFFASNSKWKMRLRVLAIVLVKVLYLVVALLAFNAIDSVLLHEFSSYGRDWYNWASLDNHIAYDYIGQRSSPKPGNILLPSYGLCEVHESAQDVKHVIVNKHRFVCELSQHILYQYVFMVLWWGMVLSIILSAIGILEKIGDYTVTVWSHSFFRSSRQAHTKLTLRQCEYLECLKKQNLSLYEDVLKKLHEQDIV
jgi:hypothetical protein